MRPSARRSSLTGDGRAPDRCDAGWWPRGRSPRWRARGPPAGRKGTPMNTVATDSPPKVVEAEPAWHTLDGNEVLEREHVDAEQGLTTADADARRLQHGPNQLAAGAREPGWRAFLRQYADPMQIVLLAA